MADQSEATAEHLLQLTSRVVTAFVSRNELSPANLPHLIVEVHGALEAIASPKVAEAPSDIMPAVPIRRSITPDYLISLEDGSRLKSLSRHLRSLGMTPAQYRAKWNLPDDYPMVAANYSATRARIAKEIGFGRKSQIAPARRHKRTIG